MVPTVEGLVDGSAAESAAGKAVRLLLPASAKNVTVYTMSACELDAVVKFTVTLR
jgi:hypothetical protein